MSIADDIMTAVKGFWLSNGRIEKHAAFKVGNTGVSTGSETFLWTPTSVDPTGQSPAKYGLALGDIRQVKPSGDWMVPLFFGIPNNLELVKVVTTALFFDGTGKLKSASDSELFVSASIKLPFELPEELFFAPEPVNAALLLVFVGMQIAEIVEKQNESDRSAAELSLGPLATMAFDQAIAGVGAAFKGAATLPDTITKVTKAWRTYQDRIKAWPLADGWPDKDGHAREFNVDKLRFWQPSVLVDEETWTLHEKIDLVRGGEADDHIILSAAGKRTTDGSLKLVTIGSAVRIDSKNLPAKSFVIKPSKTLSQGDVFGAWADALLGQTSLLDRADQDRIQVIIRKIGDKDGAKKGQDLLSWVAAAERR